MFLNKEYSSRKFHLIVVLAIIMVGLHALYVNRQSFWGDEATTHHTIASRSFPGAISRIAATQATERLQPGYLVALWGWKECFNGAIASYRYFSLGMFFLALIAILLIWKNRGNIQMGWMQGLVLGINPFWWYYSHEARSYTMSLAFVLFAILLCEWRAFKTVSSIANRIADSGMGIMVAIAVSANFYSILIAPVLFLEDIHNRKRLGWRRIIMTHSFLALFLLPFVFNYFDIGKQGEPASGTKRKPSIIQTAGLVQMTIMGASWGGPVSKLRESLNLAETIKDYLGFYVASGISIICFLSVALRLKAWRFCRVETLLGILSFFVIIYLCWWKNYPAAPRHLFLLTPMIMAWMAVGLIHKPLWLLPLLGCFMISSFLYLYNPDYSREDWRGAMNVLETRFDRKKKVVFTQNDRFIFEIYQVSNLDFYSISEWPLERPLPSYLIEARTWEIRPSEKSKLDQLKKKMGLAYMTTGIRIWKPIEND